MAEVEVQYANQLLLKIHHLVSPLAVVSQRYQTCDLDHCVVIFLRHRDAPKRVNDVPHANISLLINLRGQVYASALEVSAGTKLAGGVVIVANCI